MKKLLIITLLFLGVSQVNAQTALLIFNDSTTVKTEIYWVWKNQLKSKHGKVNTDNLAKVIFSGYSYHNTNIYDQLKNKKIKVQFIYDESYLTELNTEEINKNDQFDISNPTQLAFENALRSGILGITLPILGAAGTVLTGGVLPVIIGGITGLVFQIDSWNQVNKAGENLENRLQLLENNIK